MAVNTWLESGDEKYWLDGSGAAVTGWQEIDGIVYLGINGNLYDINDVDQVIDKDYYEKWNNSGSTTGSSKTDTDNKTK